MNEELWNEALNEISDRHLNEAIAPKKKSRLPWLGTVAAVLAASVLTAVFGPALLPDPGMTDPSGNPVIWNTDDPKVTDKETSGKPDWFDSLPLVRPLSSPEYPEMAPRPSDPYDYSSPAYQRWNNSLRAQYDQPKGYASSLKPFFRELIPLVLTETDGNAVCSPLNIYMALAMLAETAGGDSRQQVLDLLGAGSIEDSQTQAGHVWNAHYRSDGTTASLLANSLWLNEDYYYNVFTANTLADRYYASVYQGDLGSAEMNEALRSWLSEQTQGLLDNYINNISMDRDTALALASTVFFRARWQDTFLQQNNTEGIFHSPGGDVPATFMRQTFSHGPYYYGEDYSMVQLDLEFSGGMWVILPDEGCTPQDILDSGYALDAILDPGKRQSSRCMVHVSLPKFDISAETDLKEALTALGLGDLFDSTTADFTGIMPEEEQAYLGKASHATRVSIDEEGITAAAYTVMGYDGAAPPPEEEVYFTLDRPFIFVITSADGLPLFTGVVNQP